MNIHVTAAKEMIVSGPKEGFIRDLRELILSRFCGALPLVEIEIGDETKVVVDGQSDSKLAQALFEWIRYLEYGPIEKPIPTQGLTSHTSIRKPLPDDQDPINCAPLIPGVFLLQSRSMPNTACNEITDEEIELAFKAFES